MMNAPFFELDPDDVHEVDLQGPCSIDGSPVDADGVCAEGHSDLTRADAARLLDAGAAGFADVEIVEWCPCGDQPRHTPRVHPAEYVAETVADAARALGLDDEAIGRLCRAAGIDPETGDPR